MRLKIDLCGSKAMSLMCLRFLRKFKRTLHLRGIFFSGLTYSFHYCQPENGSFFFRANIQLPYPSFFLHLIQPWRLNFFNHNNFQKQKCLFMEGGVSPDNGVIILTHLFQFSCVIINLFIIYIIKTHGRYVHMFNVYI